MPKLLYPKPPSDYTFHREGKLKPATTPS